MKFGKISQNILNKSPKIALFILILFLLGHQKSSYFGYDPNKSEVKIEIPIDFVCQHYGKDVSIGSSDGIYYDVISKSDGQKVGAIISSCTFADQYSGYAGQTPVAIFLDDSNMITGVKLLQNGETRRFINRIENSGFFDQWNGKYITDLDISADAVSGATMSSSAIIKNVDAALGAVVESRASNNGRSFYDYLGSFAVIAVVILSLVSYVFPAKMKPFRVVLLISSIGVLGIWQGAFVSVQLLYNWAVYGTSWIYFGLIAIVVLAIFIPLLFSKTFYCQYLCPFGAAQELLGKVFKNKQKVPARAMTIFKYVRKIGLIGIVILLIANPNFEPSSIEPFSVFMIRSATISVIIIAGVSLVASLFINRPWCRLLCPTGEILSILQRNITYKRKNKN